MKDNQPKHRQLAKERNKGERKMPWRHEHGTALLVCEGQCTEPFYLQGVLEHFNIPPARVEIIRGQSKSNAVAVVNRARQRFEQMPRDRVFVIIDAEQADLAQALKLCQTPIQRGSRKKSLPEIRIEPIVSAPCFEYWLLLHFRYCDQPFASFTDVLPELQAGLPDYKKADPHIFLRVGGEQGLGRALANVSQLRKSREQTGAKVPSTDMDKLIEALRALQA
jgi:hypothetical protein